MFGRSKKSESSTEGAEIVRHKDKTVSSDVLRSTKRRDWHPVRGRYETRCDEHDYSMKGLPSRRDAEAWALIHKAEQHDR